MRNAAGRIAGAQRQTITDSNGVTRNVDVTDPSQTQQFADVVATASNGATLHIRVRLSDYYVVQFYFFDNNRTVGANLANDVPPLDHRYNGPAGSSTWPEGYDALARLAGVNLTDLTIGTATFDNAIQQIRNFNTGNASAAQVARSMLTFIVGIAEGARYSPLAKRIYTEIQNFRAYRLASDDVAAMRNWAATSQIYRNNGGASTSTYGVSIHDAATAAVVLLTALGARGVSNVPKDEL
ncbi:ribosome-inactivating family protein [Streptomyces sp. T028]|uniref:ribosome-inactivating family protein n=1 Tax=Streptomyces sp. T028 TaxID=3394379 RepID=UPI003A8A92CE